MDYEKAYKEALEKAEETIKYYKERKRNEASIEDLQEIFPELKESEDERIRKELIKYLKEGVEGYIPAGDRSDYQRWIAWVKKQESVREIVERCKTSWYNEGKIDGMAEGLTDDEKYQQGWHDALEKQGEQKPAEWSEEDEKHIDSLLERLEGMCKKGATFTKTRFAISQDMDWLKSLKDRIGG